MTQKILTLSAGGIITEVTDASVSSVTGTAPVVSSGGTAPAISMAAAAAGVSGYVSTTAQAFDGDKTFNGNVGVGTPAAGPRLMLKAIGNSFSDGAVKILNYNGTTASYLTSAAGYFFLSNDGTTSHISVDATGNTTFYGGVGFNNITAIAKPTITGSRAGNAALASLLTALANYGLITNSTTI